jgi:xanthine dehydrogenase YagT iron-sulfur-binding subunit
MRLRLKRRRFGQIAIASTLGTVLSSLRGKTKAQQKPQSYTQSTSGVVDVKLRINGVEHSLKIDPRVTLLDALRERLNLTGSKKGCDHGQCGACTVLIDNRRVNSCLTFAIMHTDAEITTIEGLAQGENLHPMQAAFIAHDAFQCGYCTPGQICSAVGLVNEGHAKSDADIRELMSGNICRCGAYPNIVDAVRDVIQGKKDAAV